MKFPKKCPKCKVTFSKPLPKPEDSIAHLTVIPYLLTRSELDYDSDEASRIEDQIFECSNCHMLFRARWELISFIQLIEKKETSV